MEQQQANTTQENEKEEDHSIYDMDNLNQEELVEWLFLDCLSGDTDSVRRVLEKGAPVNSSENEACTPLRNASKKRVVGIKR